MKIHSIHMIIFTNIIEYQYSASDELWDAVIESHANDMQELINISNELQKCQFTDFSNYLDYIEYNRLIQHAKKIFNQYGFPLYMYIEFSTIKL